MTKSTVEQWLRKGIAERADLLIVYIEESTGDKVPVFVVTGVISPPVKIMTGKIDKVYNLQGKTEIGEDEFLEGRGYERTPVPEWCQGCGENVDAGPHKLYCPLLPKRGLRECPACGTTEGKLHAYNCVLQNCGDCGAGKLQQHAKNCIITIEQKNPVLWTYEGAGNGYYIWKRIVDGSYIFHATQGKVSPSPTAGGYHNLKVLLNVKGIKELTK